MFTDTPLISIIIPIYKVEKYLDRCLESVINQTYKNLEIILVDDGSPDNCPQMCDGWAEKDSRIKVIHKENGGLSSARNAGLDIIKGDYVSFIDSDDYITENMIETLYGRVCSDNSDIALCNYLCVGDNGSTDAFGFENSLPVKDEVLTASQAQKKLFVNMHWHYVIACCKLYKSILMQDFRYPLGVLHEDLFTTHLLFEKCERISCIHKPLYYYYQNENSITHVYNIRRLDALEAYLSRFEFFYRKKDYFCAAMSVDFMIPKLVTAYESLDLKDKQVSNKLKYYNKQYRKNYRKVIFKKIDGVNKLGMTLYALSPFLYRTYHKIRG